MRGVRYVTLVTIDKAAITVNWVRDQYSAEIRASGVSFSGAGNSVVQAIEAALEVIRSEPRLKSKNPGKRYRVAESLKTARHQRR